MTEPAPIRSSLCAVIPAAGRGTRLGGGVPKILLPITATRTVRDILHLRLAPFADRLHFVLSPSVREHFPPPPAPLPEETLSTQDVPRGLGDAIFSAEPWWAGFDAILVVWGDQVSVSPETLARTVAAHQRGAGPRLTLPLVSQPQPYVQYVMDRATGRLTSVRQSREGDSCDAGGDSDVGVFCLATAGLAAAWRDYEAVAPRGRSTGELNFLPFLPYLCTTRGWALTPVRAGSTDEARGINTAADLDYFQRLFAQNP